MKNKILILMMVWLVGFSLSESVIAGSLSTEPSGAAIAANVRGEGLVFAGEILTIPLHLTPDSLKVVNAAIRCMPFPTPTSKTCVAMVGYGQYELIRGVPSLCLDGSELVVGFDHDILRSIRCDTAAGTFRNVANKYRKRYGNPTQDTATVAAMTQQFSEWRAGTEYVLLTHTTGHNIRGTSLDKYNVQVALAPSLPIQKK